MTICFFTGCEKEVPKGNTTFCSFEHQIAQRNERNRIARAKKRPELVCEHKGCKEMIKPPKKKFCSDEHYNLSRGINPIQYRRDNTSFEERAKYILKKKKREALLARVCGLSGCEKKLSTMRKKYCSDGHFDQAKEDARAKNNPDKICKICGTRFKPVFTRNVICKDPACKRSALEIKNTKYRNKHQGAVVVKEVKKPVVKKVREAKKVQSEFGSLTRPYSPRPKGPVPSHLNRSKRFGILAEEYQSKVEIEEITKTDLRLSQEAQAIKAFLDSGKRIKKVLFENGEKSLEFEDMDEFENKIDVSQFGNYSGSWDLTKLHY